MRLCESTLGTYAHPNGAAELVTDHGKSSFSKGEYHLSCAHSNQ